jgi:hypothetical protein
MKVSKARDEQLPREIIANKPQIINNPGTSSKKSPKRTRLWNFDVLNQKPSPGGEAEQHTAISH